LLQRAPAGRNAQDCAARFIQIATLKLERGITAKYRRKGKNAVPRNDFI
jgi:hypothetical protein